MYPVTTHYAGLCLNDSYDTINLKKKKTETKNLT